MLADQIIGSFQDYASAGYDVYLFDYRGYGSSEGKPRLRAILSDYGEIIDHLDSLPYNSRFFMACRLEASSCWTRCTADRDQRAW